MDFGLLYENDEGVYVVLNDVRMADIRLSSLVYLPCLYVSTYCVPNALLRQNKPFPLLYLGHAQIISMREDTKLVCRKTLTIHLTRYGGSSKSVCGKALIHINKGKTYGRQKFWNWKFIKLRCRRSTFEGSSALLPSDVIDFAMLPAQRFWRETLFLLDVMRPLSNEWERALLGKNFQLYNKVYLCSMFL